MTKIYEKIPRTVAKLITWRIVISTQYFLIGYLTTGNIWYGFGAVGAALVVNSILYYLHERAWNRNDWKRNVNQQ